MSSEVPLLRAIAIKLGGVDVGGSEVPAYKAIVRALGGEPAFSSEVGLLRQIVKLSGGAGNGATEVPLMEEWAQALGVTALGDTEVPLLRQILDNISSGPQPPTDPLAALVGVRFRAETHDGDDEPLGLYQDSTFTTPSVVNGNIAGWKHPLSPVGIINENPEEQPILRLLNGTPQVELSLKSLNQDNPLGAYNAVTFIARRVASVGTIPFVTLGTNGTSVSVSFTSTQVLVRRGPSTLLTVGMGDVTTKFVVISLVYNIDNTFSLYFGGVLQGVSTVSALTLGGNLSLLNSDGTYRAIGLICYNSADRVIVENYYTTLLPTQMEAVISGTARPNNVLTSTKTGQWFLNNNPVAGQAGITLTVPYTVAPNDAYTQEGSNVVFVPQYDPDALVDISSVESAGSTWGDTLNRSMWNKWLYSDLISDMKTAGVYTATEFRKCLMGPTTLAGVAACGIGGVITNNGPFVAGDLSSLGTKGNGASKYWASNRAGNANAQDDFSWWAWITAPCTTGDTVLRSFFGQSTTTSAGSVRASKSAALNVVVARGKNATDDISSVSASDAIGLVGLSRSNSANYSLRIGGITETIVKVSDGNLSTVMQFLARAGTNFSDARIGFLGGGASLNLPALETCLQNYQTRRALVP